MVHYIIIEPGQASGYNDGYKLDAWDSIPDGGKRFSLLHRVQTGCGALQPPIKRIPRAYSPAVKRPRREAHRSAAFSAEVKMMDLYFYFPLRPHEVVFN
jgi:hypothetical protein